MIFMNLSRTEIQKSQLSIENYYIEFLQQWAALNSYDLAGKHKKLQELQPVIEMEEFLRFGNHDSNFSSVLSTKKLLSKWRYRFPSTKLDDINVWDTVVYIRSILLEKLYSRFSAIPSKKMVSEQNLEMQPDQYRKLLHEEKADLFKEMATTARKQNNFVVGDQYLKESFDITKKCKKPLFPVFHEIIKMSFKKAKRMSDVDEKPLRLVKVRCCNRLYFVFSMSKQSNRCSKIWNWLKTISEIRMTGNDKSI